MVVSNGKLSADSILDPSYFSNTTFVTDIQTEIDGPSSTEDENIMIQVSHLLLSIALI